MSEMIERVALAIKAELGRQMDAVPLADSQPGDWYSARGGEVQLEQVVRVALAAMREPTEEQFQGEWWDNLCKGPPTRRAHWIWQSMIDAALK